MKRTVYATRVADYLQRTIRVMQQRIEHRLTPIPVTGVKRKSVVSDKPIIGCADARNGVMASGQIPQRGLLLDQDATVVPWTGQ